MSTLPANEPGCSETAGAVSLVVEARPRPVGSVTVARALPSVKRRAVGPFVFLDHMGPIELAPGAGFDIRPHPHIGLSTVTYFLAGSNVHRDSMGNERVNVPGDVNIMTAGRGVVHSERAEPGFRASGGTMHGLQIWLGLPLDHEDDEPSFEHHPQHTLPAIAPATGVRGRVLLGEAFGAASPIVHPSAPLLVDLELAAGAAVDVAPAVPERAVFVVEGEVEVGGTVLAKDHMGVLGERARLIAHTASRVALLGGASLGPRFIEWNFVASSRERIEAAKAAWKAQTFPKIPTDADEFVPLPE